MATRLQQLANEDNKKMSTDFPFVDGITDVAIIVQNSILYVNKGILCVASPVFHTMLTSDFKEKDGVVNLPEKKVNEVTMLMKMIYPNIHLPLNEAVIEKILPLAAEYMMEASVQKCDRYLAKRVECSQSLRSKEKLDRLMTFVNYGCIYNMKLVQEEAVKALAKWKSVRVEDHVLYKKFTEDVKQKIQAIRFNLLEKVCEDLDTVRTEFLDHKLCSCFTTFSYMNTLKPPSVICNSCKSSMRLLKVLEPVRDAFSEVQKLQEDPTNFW